MFFFRFLAPLAIALCLVAYLLLPWTDRLFQNWAEADLKARSSLVFSSIQDGLPENLNIEQNSQLAKRFTQFAQDERLIGIGYCDAAGVPKVRNRNFPGDIACPSAVKSSAPYFDKKTIKGGPVLIGTYPVEVASVSGTPKQGYLLIVHDMSYVDRRSANTQHYILVSVFAVNLLAAFITVIIARLTLSRWISNLREYVLTGKRARGLPREALGITREIQQRLRQLERERQRLPLTGPKWTSEVLFDFVRHHLPSEQIITVSHRQPYAHVQTAEGLTWTTPASGLVTAIEPIMKACRGTWIAAASSEADRLAAGPDGALMVPPGKPTYRLKRLWLSAEEEAGFYAGFSNEGLWPLCNMAYVKPRFRASDWKAYYEVNKKFADAIAAEAKSSSPIVFIQDYHFGLLPKLVRERFPHALIIVFWHVPWPNSETFGILPWREEFLRGLVAADIIGFHTQFHCNNFLDCIDTHIEALVDREHNTVRHGNDFCKVRPYPISIAWPDFDSLEVPDIPTCRQDIMERLGIDPKTKLIVGVERLDYTKGIPERMRAFGRFLEKNSDWQGKACFIQVASPSRTIIPAYAEIDHEVERIAESINKEFGTELWKPVHLLRQNFLQPDVYKFYRAADVCVVSSLHDGMNLVAKEFISAREDERGTLILSPFAGSSRELLDAIIVNPYDEEGLANSILRALLMNTDEQSARMKSMREHVKSNNVFAWAAQILGDAAQLHERRQINDLLRKATHPQPEITVTQKENIVPWTPRIKIRS